MTSTTLVGMSRCGQPVSCQWVPFWDPAVSPLSVPSALARWLDLATGSQQVLLGKTVSTGLSRLNPQMASRWKKTSFLLYCAHF